MNELDLAKDIRDGIAFSPSRCGNASLFALRISGSGIAERKRLNETAYRPPEIWTGEEMLQRAAGLPVIALHPKKGELDAEEYERRVIGAVVLPYAKDGELWGIARIFPDDAVEAMASGEFSTSPGATFKAGDATLVAGADGVLLIEGNPSLLDHVAVVPNNGNVGGGVWDKGGAGAGIRVDSMESVMADEKGKTEEKPNDEHGAKLDKLMESIGGIADMCASMGSRLDALEKPRTDFAGEDRRITPDPDKANKKSDAADKPGFLRAGMDLPDEPKEAEERADAQHRCDSVAIAHGAKAPPPMAGERPRAYRERLLKNYKHFSREFGDVDFSLIPAGQAFDAIEARVYADAIAAANNPTTKPGQLISRTKKLDSGHTVNEFYGDIGTWLCPPVSTRATFRQRAA
jgi:hypothetical protein